MFCLFWYFNQLLTGLLNYEKSVNIFCSCIKLISLLLKPELISFEEIFCFSLKIRLLKSTKRFVKEESESKMNEIYTIP